MRDAYHIHDNPCLVGLTTNKHIVSSVDDIVYRSVLQYIIAYIESLKTLGKVACTKKWNARRMTPTKPLTDYAIMTTQERIVLSSCKLHGVSKVYGYRRDDFVSFLYAVIVEEEEDGVPVPFVVSVPEHILPTIMPYINSGAVNDQTIHLRSWTGMYMTRAMNLIDDENPITISDFCDTTSSSPLFVRLLQWTILTWKSHLSARDQCNPTMIKLLDYRNNIMRHLHRGRGMRSVTPKILLSFVLDLEMEMLLWSNAKLGVTYHDSVLSFGDYYFVNSQYAPSILSNPGDPDAEDPDEDCRKHVRSCHRELSEVVRASNMTNMDVELLIKEMQTKSFTNSLTYPTVYAGPVLEQLDQPREVATDQEKPIDEIDWKCTNLMNAMKNLYRTMDDRKEVLVMIEDCYDNLRSHAVSLTMSSTFNNVISSLYDDTTDKVTVFNGKMVGRARTMAQEGVESGDFIHVFPANIAEYAHLSHIGWPGHAELTRDPRKLIGENIRIFFPPLPVGPFLRVTKSTYLTEFHGWRKVQVNEVNSDWTINIECIEFESMRVNNVTLSDSGRSGMEWMRIT